MSKQDDISTAAKKMRALHDGGDLSRRLSKYNTHEVGLIAEAEFGDRFGLEVDMTLRPSGDGGIDFEFDGFVIDVKSTVYSHNTSLLVEAGKDYKADIFVLALVNMQCRSATLMGWEFDCEVVKYPTGTMPGQSIVNHIVLATDLRHMDQFLNCRQLYDNEYGKKTWRGTMQIKIRDYRGVERADIDLDKIALIAGRNEQGKTCVLEATRAALCGMAIPIAGVLKKDAKLLVRDGAERGHASVQLDEASMRLVNWPSAIVNFEGSDDHPIKCSDYASGLVHILDYDPKSRAAVLAMYIDSTPTKEDVEAAAKDAGYQDSAIAKIWEGVRDGGWDATYQRARDYTVKLKGQWEQATGERKYGAKKAADWKPEVFDFDDKPVDLGDDREALVDKYGQAEQAVLDTAGAVAVSEAEIERLNRQVAAANNTENRMQLNDELNSTRDKLQKSQAERSKIPDDPAKTPILQAACPECGAVLVVEYPSMGSLSLRAYGGEGSKKVLSKEILERRAGLDERISEDKSAIAALEDRITTANGLIATAEIARKRLDEINRAPKLDEVAIQRAKDEFSHAQALVLAFDAKTKGDKLHGDLVKNEKLIAILAPDGLRRRKLATKLEEFNGLLSRISTGARWPVVRLDEKLEGHYGTRPIWSASKSGQWRARTVIQIAMAMVDGSAAVLLDDADLLDSKGRNGLFAALENAIGGQNEIGCNLRALVCMTFSKREQVPDLAALGDGFGHSYWIENGNTELIV